MMTLTTVRPWLLASALFGLLISGCATTEPSVIINNGKTVDRTGFLIMDKDKPFEAMPPGPDVLEIDIPTLPMSLEQYRQEKLLVLDAVTFDKVVYYFGDFKETNNAPAFALPASYVVERSLSKALERQNSSLLLLGDTPDLDTGGICLLGLESVSLNIEDATNELAANVSILVVCDPEAPSLRLKGTSRKPMDPAQEVKINAIYEASRDAFAEAIELAFGS
ncbi:hypothetical protein WNY37_07080 [Henriciella sp. AS95]|uniref:hypothetical protein n=1 Tax=Henriciella sp. AS95 TaxID=3135782 RepID=UPI0031744AA8